MPYITPRLSPVWKLFVSDKIPEDAPASVTTQIDSYALPSGEVLKPIDVVLEGEWVNLAAAAGGFVADTTCGLLVGILNADSDGTALYGAGADWWWNCFVNGETTRNPIAYHVGEDIEFVFHLNDPCASTSGRMIILVWQRRGDDGVSASGAEIISPAQPVRISTSLSHASSISRALALATTPARHRA